MKTYATAKVSGARVTGAELEYEGSVTLGCDIMELAGIEELEKVHINSLETGAHWETYVIRGEGTEIQLNGPPALLFSPGDRVVVVRYEELEKAPDRIRLVCFNRGGRIDYHDKRISQ